MVAWSVLKEPYVAFMQETCGGSLRVTPQRKCHMCGCQEMPFIWGSIVAKAATYHLRVDALSSLVTSCRNTKIELSGGFSKSMFFSPAPGCIINSVC